MKQQQQQSQKTELKQWNLVKLGDVVSVGKDSEYEPLKNGLTKYVAGEHIESEKLFITKFGDIERNQEVIGSAFIRKFSKGDVLFGTRRAYLKKSAIVTFEGICSNTTLVFRVNGKGLIKELLPFILQWKKFNDHAVEKSVGSTNPYVRWRDLATFEFEIPSKPMQERIANILWAIQKSIDSLENLIENNRIYQESKLEELVCKGIGHNKFEKIPWYFEEKIEVTKDWDLTYKIGDLVQFLGGSQPPKTNFSTESKKDYVRLIQIRDYKTDKFCIYVPKDSVTKFCHPDDAMIGRYGPPNFQIFRGLEGAYNVALIKTIPDKKINKDYLYYFLKQKRLFVLMDYLGQRTAGQDGVELDVLRALPLPLPSADEQEEIVMTLDNIIKQSKESKLHLSKLYKLRNKITDSLFTQKITLGDKS